ncbi:hypothetical protein D6C77_01837 [Aureobasidium pullulans]|uniref:Uncharacterized protein n=1 Tax=Aureobasidium pullulans TaxID=5580 RepID=A0A4T0DRJ6_AURPU|nr:hypothetical protein D6D20_05453 [Aureobasidium pullulans]THW92467.1 hypothetical protein D6D15_03100 [Aureobasidium pullulans]THX44532.1 hypothetical protein D6D10_00383 [Aureobasidium pullulans]THX93547.1 hypothetical protein D6D08_02025 [Aureobasidium pullulans]THY21874.1 hypothetical protein D6D02_01390 [Aureobasidium pullulans]
MRATKPGGLVFNFSELPAAPNDLYKKAATPRLKRAGAEKSPVIVVEDDGSPLFEPLGDQTPDQTEMVPAPSHARGARKSTDPKMDRPAQKTDPTRPPARPPGNGSHSKTKANANQLDRRPKSEHKRFTYRDIGGIGREIWQPGDPDGMRGTEFTNNTYTKRWRFFQTDIGPIERGTNSPPHYVVLDDKAAWDIMSSKKYTNKDKGDFWALDFTTGGGRVLAARFNKGRAAVVAKGTGMDVDEKDGRGVRHVGYTVIGEKDKKRPYCFSGEKGGYEEIIFNVPTAEPVAANQTSVLDDGNGTENPTATQNAGRKIGLLGKRKAEESLNPRHKREKVGKYLHSTPSPTWPGGSRRLNKPPVQRARDADRELDDHFYGSELSPQIAAGGKTVYAANAEEDPERVNGLLVTSGWRTPHGARTEYAIGANTPFVDRSLDARTPRREPASRIQSQLSEMEPDSQLPSHDTGYAQGSEQPLWQDIKRIEEELLQARGLLRSRDGEIASLRAQLNDPKAAGALRAKDIEIQRLKEELRQALSGDY